MARRRRYGISLIQGGFQLPSMMDGCLSFGQYIRMVTVNASRSHRLPPARRGNWQLLDSFANGLERAELVLFRVETVGVRPVGCVNGFLEPVRKIAFKLRFVRPRL